LIQNKIALSSIHLGNTLTFKLMDQGLLETIGPFGVFSLYKKNKNFSYFQSGFLFHYLLTSIAFIFGLLLLWVLPTYHEEWVVITIIGIFIYF